MPPTGGLRDTLPPLLVKANPADSSFNVTAKKIVLEFNEYDPLVEWLKTNLTKDDAVLIKGSHGLRMDRITSLLEVRS